jgi:hypothetical protein
MCVCVCVCVFFLVLSESSCPLAFLASSSCHGDVVFSMRLQIFVYHEIAGDFVRRCWTRRCS